MLVPKERIHGFVAATLRRWGFRSRVTLDNYTGEAALVDVVVRRADGTVAGRGHRVARIAHGELRFWDVDELCRSLNLPPPERDDYVLNFSLVPERFSDATGPVDITKEEIFRITTLRDHYIEHYDPATGFSSGVLYMTPLLNDRLLSPRSTFMMQAPKVFLSEERNTVVQAIHYSSDPDYVNPGTLYCALRRPEGDRVAEWRERVPPHAMRYLDAKEALARAGVDWRRAVGRHGFLFFEAFSPDAGFVPLTININENRRTFDMEHSLPPPYYGSKYGGARKGEMIAAWTRTFPAPVPPVEGPRARP